MLHVRIGALLGALAAASVGCSGAGEATSATSAKAKLLLENATGGGASTALSAQSVGGLRLSSEGAPSTAHFSMKMSNISLLEDVDPVTQDDVGFAPALWVNPNCTSADDCDGFDFARPTAVVNADLNSQALDVAAGTYRYLRMELCYHGERPTEPNIEWQGGSMTSPHGIVSEMCAVTSTEYDPPLVLKPGDSVSVSLGYDLSGATAEGTVGAVEPATGPDGGLVGFDDCVSLGATTETCFSIPRFVPIVSVSDGGAGHPVLANDAGAGEER
jgi:hypothetical protein